MCLGMVVTKTCRGMYVCLGEKCEACVCVLVRINVSVPNTAPMAFHGLKNGLGLAFAIN